MGDKKGYKVLSPIIHNGNRYEIGEMIELLPEEAKALARSRAVNAGEEVEYPSEQLVADLKKKIAEQDEFIRILRSDLEIAQKTAAQPVRQNDAAQAQKGKGKK